MCYINKVATYGLELGEKMRKKPENFCKIAIVGSEKVLGRIVLSTAGRDCGKHFIIVGIEDENHLILADGRLRRIENPKKKKLRHVKVLKYEFPEVRDKLMFGKPILNSELRYLILKYENDAVNNPKVKEVSCV